MLEEKIKWNEKYAKNFISNPSPLLKYIPPKKAKALDLAGGIGANAEILLQKGYDVTLIDISDIAISKITLPIKKICLDLDNYIIPQNEYDVILMIKYFNLNLLRQIPKALKKDGFFVFKTGGKYSIEKDLFFDIFKNFQTLHFKEDFEYVGVKKVEG